MTVYVLLSGVTAQQGAPGTTEGGAPGSNLPTGSQAASVGSSGAGALAQVPAAQTFHCIVRGTSGSVSATVQPLCSNDGINWLNYGAAIAITSGATPQQGSAIGAGCWAYFSAYVTAISGTGANVACLMNC